ncbi:MAG TPA: ferrous iron transporter B, partial [Rectinemataceae bacterium]|nr:ferrous iron transporter B [Rectinemataceae bacterium]
MSRDGAVTAAGAGASAAAEGVRPRPGAPGPSGARAIKVALAGNPNAGKTTLFNALTGSHHKVGNYPGVTVEKREGRCTSGGVDFEVFDLPGIYSLTAYSMDEVVARDFILDERPDVVVDVMDSTNLERHLYLCMQFQELGIPVVAALNMMDEAGAVGISIDAPALGRLLGIPFVKTVGTRGLGTGELLGVVAAQANSGCGTASRRMDYGSELEPWLARIEALVASDPAFGARYPARWLSVKLLEKDANAAERLAAHPGRDAVLELVAAAIAWTESHFGRDAEIVVSEQRYAYIHGAVAETVSVAGSRGRPVTEAVDRVLMNRFLGLPLFLLILWGVFQATFSLGAIPQAWLEGLFGGLAGLAGR